MKDKLKLVGKVISTVSILILIIIVVIAVILMVIEILCPQSEKFIHYGDENYTFISAEVESGRYSTTYNGSITIEDYDKWTNGESGTIIVYNLRNEMISRISINHIISIVNYGSAPTVENIPLKYY